MNLFKAVRQAELNSTRRGAFLFPMRLGICKFAKRRNLICVDGSTEYF